MDGRRLLEYGRLDEVMPEVDRLLRGHFMSGAWSLGQILHHLNSTVRATLAGGPGSPAGDLDPELARVFEVRRRRFFRAGRFPDGAEVPDPSFAPPPDADERVEAESLRSALLGFEDSEGPFPAHPRLGPLSKGEWADFHRLHCAHHLGFARPTSNDCHRIEPPSGGASP
jgi:hypothetical protein